MKMYNTEDILIVGDSFCQWRDLNVTWPQLVMCELTKSDYDPAVLPRGKGHGGEAWWSYRKTLINELEYKVPKLLIMCHTEPFRIPNDHGYMLNLATVQHKLKNPKEEFTNLTTKVAKAASEFYLHLYSREYFFWANTQWFQELDQLCEHYDIEKVLHFYCIEGPYGAHTFNRGVTVSTPFSTLDVVQWDDDITEQYNHFSVENNKMIADYIVDLVNNYPGNNLRVEIKANLKT